MFPIPAEKPDSPRTPRSPEPPQNEERKGSADTSILSTKITQQALESTFLYFRRAIVRQLHHILSALSYTPLHMLMLSWPSLIGHCINLQILAYRGQHWTLLQNATRALWNCAHTALTRAFTNDPQSKTGLLTLATLRKVLWFPFTIACDHWLDMMFCIRSQLHSEVGTDTPLALIPFLAAVF